MKQRFSKESTNVIDPRLGLEHSNGRRLLTLGDAVELFNLVLGTQLDPQEKADLVVFMCQL